MQQDVWIAEWQKIKNQGRDDHIKQLSMQPPIGIFTISCLMTCFPSAKLYKTALAFVLVFIFPLTVIHFLWYNSLPYIFAFQYICYLTYMCCVDSIHKDYVTHIF